MTMPTDPLAKPGADALPVAVPPPGGAPSPARRGPPKPAYPGPDRCDPARNGYAGPERRETAGPIRMLGMPRWLVLSSAGYLVALALALLWIFNY